MWAGQRRNAGGGQEETAERPGGQNPVYQLASVLAGGLSSLIAAALLAGFGYSAVAAYTAAMALIAVISVYLATETFEGDITETQEAEHRLIGESSGGSPGSTVS